MCRIEGCNAPAKAVGLCNKHYLRGWKYGSAEAPLPERNTKLPWIRKHVNYSADDCLQWPFARHRSGYGVCHLNGKRMSAPRVMCLMAHGEPPTAEHVTRHSCGKGHLGCMNPKHLSWGTGAANQAGRLSHGTSNRGKNSPLTAEQVLKIRARYADGLSTQAMLAADYGVSRATIGNIVTGATWGWLAEHYGYSREQAA